MRNVKGAAQTGAVFAFLAKNKLFALGPGLPAEPVDKTQLHKMGGMVSRKQTFDIRSVIHQCIVKQGTRKIINEPGARELARIKKPVFAFVFIINHWVGFYKKRYSAKLVHGIYA